ncbi:MAG: ABC transporter ATP-binding protein [Actinomycetota bacterium]
MLEVTGLDVRYGAARALWGTDLQVEAGEVVTVVGPNGAGKTTLVNAIAGLIPIRAGKISMGGADLAGFPSHRVCEAGVAIVPEGRRIFSSMTAEENLLLGAHRQAARPTAKQRAGEVYELFPRLRERARQRAGTLSGGEQQMLSIGRALMSNPRMLLMDEPSLGLAPVMVDRIFTAIGEIAGSGTSILLVEQNIARALDVSTRGYLMNEGRIVLSGTPEWLRANKEVRRICLGI